MGHGEGGQMGHPTWGQQVRKPSKGRSGDRGKTRPILLDPPFVLGPGPVAGPLPAAKPAGHPLRATVAMTDTAVLAQRHPVAASGPCGLSASDQLPGAAGSQPEQVFPVEEAEARGRALAKCENQVPCEQDRA